MIPRSPARGRPAGHRRLVAWSFFLACAALSPAYAQLVVELPFDPGIPARVTVSRSWTEPIAAVKKTEPRPPLRSGPAGPATAGMRPAISPPSGITDLLAAFFTAPVATLTPLFIMPARSAAPPPPIDPLVLSTFSGDAASGGIRSGTTWVGNVTQGSGFITIGGTAGDDNGWGATGLLLNATGMSYITITAQRHAGHAAGSLFLQFEDRASIPHVFSLSSLAFAVGTPTQAQIVIGAWPSEFDFTRITSWSIGGGGLGLGLGGNDFRMSLHHLEFGATAIPEPSTYTAIAGAVMLAFAVWQRRTVAPSV